MEPSDRPWALARSLSTPAEQLRMMRQLGSLGLPPSMDLPPSPTPTAHPPAPWELPHHSEPYLEEHGQTSRGQQFKEYAPYPHLARHQQPRQQEQQLLLQPRDPPPGATLAERWAAARVADEAAWLRQRAMQQQEWALQQAQRQRQWELQRQQEQQRWEHQRQVQQALWDQWQQRQRQEWEQRRAALQAQAEALAQGQAQSQAQAHSQLKRKRQSTGDEADSGRRSPAERGSDSSAALSLSLNLQALQAAHAGLLDQKSLAPVEDGGTGDALPPATAADLAIASQPSWERLQPPSPQQQPEQQPWVKQHSPAEPDAEDPQQQPQQQQLSKPAAPRTPASPAALAAWCKAVQQLLDQLKGPQRLTAEQLQSWKEQQQWLMAQKQAWEEAAAATAAAAAQGEPAAGAGAASAEPVIQLPGALPVPALQSEDSWQPLGDTSLISVAAGADDWWMSSLFMS